MVNFDDMLIGDTRLNPSLALRYQVTCMKFNSIIVASLLDISCRSRDGWTTTPLMIFREAATHHATKPSRCRFWSIDRRHAWTESSASTAFSTPTSTFLLLMRMLLVIDFMKVVIQLGRALTARSLPKTATGLPKEVRSAYRIVEQML